MSADIAVVYVGVDRAGTTVTGGHIGASYTNSWKAGSISVTESDITLNAFAAEGSSSSGRSSATCYFGGLIFYK